MTTAAISSSTVITIATTMDITITAAAAITIVIITISSKDLGSPIVNYLTGCQVLHYWCVIGIDCYGLWWYNWGRHYRY